MEFSRILSFEFGTPLSITATKDEWPNSEGIAKRKNSVIGNERNRGIRTLDPFVQPPDGIKNVVGRKLGNRCRGLKFVGEDVDKQFGVAVRVEVSTVILVQFAGQFASVREVPIVNEDDSVGGVDEEWLSLVVVCCTSVRRVADVTETEVSREPSHVTSAERFANLALGFCQVQGSTFACRDARGVLTAMLQQGEGVVNLLVDGSR